MYVIKKKFKRKKGNVIFYYLVENKIVDKQPKMIHKKYLGNAEKILMVYEFYEKKHKK